MRVAWWHVHDGPPYRCHGGATDHALAVNLLEVIRESESSATTVESLDDPVDCAYHVPGWVVLTGRQQHDR